MTEARALIPVVMGVGLAALTTNQTSRPSREGERHAWQAPLFILAVQLVGFALVALALYVVAFSVERGRPLSAEDVGVENRLIAALALLIVIVAVRNAWNDFVRSSEISPWDRGLLDRVTTLLMLTIAVLLIVLLGLGLDELLIQIGTSSLRMSKALISITGLLVVSLGAAFYMLRRLVGGDPSPRAFAMLRREQLGLLRELDGAHGGWVPIRIRPVGELDPDLVFSALAWSSERGLYWRPDDAYALARYHSWVGDHAKVPTVSLHLQRVSVLAGEIPDSMRGMRITSTTRRLWWIDAFRSHRGELPLVSDAGSPERRAGLVHIAYEQLQAAGLLVTVGPASSVAHHPTTNGRR